MKRMRILSLLTAAVIALPGFASAATVPDEQLLMPRPPVENVGGYSGVYYDDQQTLKRAFTYIETWSETATAISGYTTCKSALEEPCATSSRVFLETPLSPCTVSRAKDCITNLAIIPEGKTAIAGQLVEEVEMNFGDNLMMKARYASPFTGNPARGIPDSGKASIWKFPGMSHSGGDEYLVIPKVNAEFQDLAGSKPSNLDVAIFPVSRSATIKDCFYQSMNACFIRWPFPQETSYSIGLRTSAKIVGWVHGRVSEPTIDVSVKSDGQTEISVTGTPISVPVLAAWSKNSELPAELDRAIEEEFIARGNVFAGVAYFGGNAKSRAEQAVSNEINPSFDDKGFERYLMWVKVAQDKAYANISAWSFRSMRDVNQYKECLGVTGVAGIVSTNSNAYLAGPPKFDGTDLAYKVASPHYNAKGEEQLGSYDLAIRTDVARCIYKFSSAPIKASLSILYGDGIAKTATTVISQDDKWLRLSAKGFTYSSPTIKVSLTQEKSVVQNPTPSPTPSAKPIVAKKTSITCVKGKTSKKVTAINPKCPTGYKKK